MNKKFIHIKTGDTYELIRDDVKNCTNANDKQIMVLYKRPDYPDLIFVREKEEFFLKFKQVEKIYSVTWETAENQI